MSQAGLFRYNFLLQEEGLWLYEWLKIINDFGPTDFRGSSFMGTQPISTIKILLKKCMKKEGQRMIASD